MSYTDLTPQEKANCLPRQETQVRSLGWEDPLEEERATHSSILAWRIPWTEEPDGLQAMGLQRVGHTESPKQQTTSSVKSSASLLLIMAWGAGGSVPGARGSRDR